MIFLRDTQDATLTYSLKSTPPMLCIQLMRFGFDMVRQKVTDCIKFPEHLQLGKYLESGSGGSGGSGGGCGGGGESSVAKPASSAVSATAPSAASTRGKRNSGGTSAAAATTTTVTNTTPSDNFY